MSDGSFCVEVGIRVAGGLPTEVATRVQEWLNEVWMPRNETWTREWKSGSKLENSTRQILHYGDEFTAAPAIAVGPDSELQMQLRGQKTAKFWRDWLVSRLVPDLKEAFPAIGDLLYMRDCVPHEMHTG